MSDAIDRIRVHRFCPRCGSETIQVQTPQLVACPACDLHLYSNPGAATAAILLDAADRVLLIRRAREPARGLLAFPGGFVDDGESAEAGLRRELREELGLEVPELRFLTSRPNSYPYRGIIYPTLDLFFVAQLDTFAGSRALDGVAGLVTVPANKLRAEELAFVSMREAWGVFLAQRGPQAWQAETSVEP